MEAEVRHNLQTGASGSGPLGAAGGSNAGGDTPTAVSGPIMYFLFIYTRTKPVLALGGHTKTGLLMGSSLS